MRAAFLAILMLWTAHAAAQTTYKCTDAQRRVTYSNEACEKQGLRDAGPIADRVTSMPFAAPPKPEARKETARPLTPREREERDSGGGAQIKPNLPAPDKPSK